MYALEAFCIYDNPTNLLWHFSSHSLGALSAALLIHPLNSSVSRDFVAPLMDVPVLCYGDEGNRAPERLCVLDKINLPKPFQWCIVEMVKKHYTDVSCFGQGQT